MLGDLNPLGGRVDCLSRPASLGAWLGIEGLELAGPAVHEQQDAGPALLRSSGAAAVMLSVKFNVAAARSAGEQPQERPARDDAVAVGGQVHQGMRRHSGTISGARETRPS